MTALVLAAGGFSLAAPATTAAAPSGPFDGTAPALTLQPPRFVLGKSIDATDPDPNGCDLWHVAIPMELRWNASDTGSGLAGFELYTVLSFDGAAPVVVDTYAAAAQNRVLVWQVQFPSTAAHTVVVTNMATAGRSRVDVDAVVVQ